MTEDLITFLRARLDEDERRARSAAAWYGDSDTASLAPNWRKVAVGHIWNDLDGEVADASHGRADHIVRYNPARVLADIESKRRIIDQHELSEGHCDTCTIEVQEDAPLEEIWHGAPEVAWIRRPVSYPCPTLRLLALPYADQPDYQEGWRP